ncbi:hypothetical protein M432DRAFT_590731 [Thermoascus aurantiacus ATCC 26904]
MKFSIIALSGLAALAAAQTTLQTSPAPAATSLSPEAKCAANCASSDICCLAACYRVPCPSEAMANDTTACAAACPQGSGTPSDTEAYAKCQQQCFSSHFFPATATLPVASGSATVAGTSATPTSDSTSGSSSSGSSASRTGSSASSTASGTAPAASTGAASHLGASTAGILGVIMAAFAL